MNVQQFTGASMRDVLTKVRDALGADALILETRDTSDGIVVSAVPEALATTFSSQPSEVEQAQSRAESDGDAAAAEKHMLAEQTKELGAVLASATGRLASNEEVGAVREEIRSIRSLVESHLAHVGWNEAALGSPLKASVMRNLSALGIAPDIVRTLVETVDPAQLRGRTWAVPMKLLIEKLPVADAASMTARRIAVVGPTGAGKTTTIARLAARHAIDKSAEDLAIVSLDNHRLGSSEQIDALARVLGVKVHRPVGDRGLEDLSDALNDAGTTLIDTVGLGQHDSRLPEQLARLAGDVCTLLVLPANLEHDAMQEIVDAFAPCRPAGIVLTKVDEAATLGAALSVVMRSQLPIVWISDGQEIPNGLHAAATSQAWLIKLAVELMRRRRVLVSERYMAENFFRAQAQEPAHHG